MHVLFAVLLALTQPWLVVSDLHVEPFDTSAQPAPYGSDTNWALFDAALAAMQRAQPHPAVVVIAGDFLAHHFDSAVSASKTGMTVTAAAEGEMRRIERSFANAFPNSQFIITLGNNDDPCGDYSTAPDSQYMRKIARLWAPLVNRHGTAPNFLRDFPHGYYETKLPLPRARALVMDDVYWSIVYHGCAAGSKNPTSQQFAWLSRTLTRSSAARSIIVLHIPPGIDENSTLLARRFIVVQYLRGGVQAQLERILSSNARHVSFVLAGHMHQNEFRLAGGVPVLVAPSISPVYANNPAFLKLAVGDEGTLTDYQQIAYDPESAQWIHVLDFDRTYGVGSFSADAIRAIHDRLPRDPSLRQTWSAAMVGGSPNLRADSNTFRAFWCAQTSSPSSYAACAGDQRRVAALSIAAAVVAAIVLLALVALGLRLATQHRRA
jgi:predicted phosphodiesterase